MTVGEKTLQEGLNICINYELNLLDYVGVAVKGGARRGENPLASTIYTKEFQHFKGLSEHYLIIYNLQRICYSWLEICVESV